PRRLVERLVDERADVRGGGAFGAVAPRVFALARLVDRDACRSCGAVGPNARDPVGAHRVAVRPHQPPPFAPERGGSGGLALFLPLFVLHALASVFFSLSSSHFASFALSSSRSRSHLSSSSACSTRTFRRISISLSCFVTSTPPRSLVFVVTPPVRGLLVVLLEAPLAKILPLLANLFENPAGDQCVLQDVREDEDDDDE